MIRSTPCLPRLAFLVALIVMITAPPVDAQTPMVIDAVADIWLRESTPTVAYSDDLISVWDGTTTDQRRHGVVMFDLSSTVGVNIEKAFLNLFDRDDSRSASAAINQEAFLLGTTPPTFPNFFEEYTWEEYVTFDEATESPLTSLGAYDIAAGDTIDGYESSDFASAADITLLEQTRNAQSGNQANLVAFILKAVSGERDWGDIEVDGTPPQLVINQDPVDPGDFDFNGAIDTADYQIMIDPNNWLQEVPNGTLGGRGDITGNGIVDLDDFSAFKPIFLENNPGGQLSAPVPEPSTLTVALFCTACLLLAARLRINPSTRLATACMHVVTGSCAATSWRKVQWVMLSAGMALSITPAVQAITLEATTDVWFRESQPDRGVFESDLMSVWNSFGNDGARRYGVVEFDVSSLAGIDVTFAGLQLWDEDNGFSDDQKPIKQSAVVVDTSSGTQVAGWSWNIYQNEFAASATPLEGLGSYDLPGRPSPTAFVNSIGTTADQALIESIAASTVGNQLLTIVMIADEETFDDEGMGVDLAHSWGDGPDGFGGMNAQLVINEPFPEVVELALQINAANGSISIVNPGVDPIENTMFEIDGYVIQSPAAALNPGGFTGITGAGETGWDIVAPTSSALSELSLNSSVTLAEGDSFSLGTGYTPGAAEDPDLTFQYNVAGGSTANGNIMFVSDGGGELDGDYNGDNVVNAADYVVWRDNLGQSITLPGEVVTPGEVTPEDFDAWKVRFGNTAASAAASAIPEPSTCFGGWVLVGLLWLQRSKFGFTMPRR